MTPARTVAERYRAVWAREHAIMTELVNGAANDGSHLPQNYWEAEHAARGRYHLALRVAEAMEEVA